MHPSAGADTSAGLLVLSGSQVDSIAAQFTPTELTTLMARVFAALAVPESPGVAIPPRSAIASEHHRTLFMPARVASFGTAIKIVSVPLEGTSGGLPASIAVLDERTGEVAALVNARKLTALRNAASSLLATQLLLSPSLSEPRTLVAIGAGAQISAHASLFLASFPSLKTCTIFNRTKNGRLSALVEHLQAEHPDVTITGHALEGAGDELQRAIGAAQIVVTATSSTSPLFPAAWVQPGTHLCLIGSYTPQMHEVDTELIRRASKVVVDYKAGALTEAGELIAADVGADDVLELGELLRLGDADGPWQANKTKVGEATGGNLTLFKSVGVGAQDAAIAHAVVDRARSRGLMNFVEGYYR